MKIKYDGITINDQIRGFKVKSVTGRELLGAEITERERPVLAGTQFIKRRYPARDITVTFQIQAPTEEAYRIRFNKLNALLNKKEVQIIFSDEVDKYFVASTSEMNANEIVFHCTDPFKYSTVIKSFPASVIDGVLTANIENKGTVEVPIDYKIRMNHENGYIGIVSENGAMQYGKKEEADGVTETKSERLLQISDFISAPVHPLYGTAGTLKTATWFNNTFLTLGNVGTIKGNANGGMRTVTIPADSGGAIGAKNWYSYFHLIFYAGLMGQTGEMAISFLTEDNKLIAGVNWNKTDMSGNTAYYDFVTYDGSKTNSDAMKGKVLKTFTYTTSHVHAENPWYWDWGHCDLKKEEDKLTFFYYGSYYSYIVPEIKNMVCKKIQVSCKAWKGGNKLLTYFGFNVLDFHKSNVQYWRDIPNRYPNGTNMIIKGNEGKMYVNGMPRPADEITGTEYFYAKPGITKVEFYHSSFSDPAPTITAEIREAWL